MYVKVVVSNTCSDMRGLKQSVGLVCISYQGGNEMVIDNR